MDNYIKAAYTPTISIQGYGNEAVFGEYNKETHELKITDWTMVGDTDLEKLKQELDKEAQRDGLHGSHMLIGIPKDIYQLRERFRSSGTM